MLPGNNCRDNLFMTPVKKAITLTPKQERYAQERVKMHLAGEGSNTAAYREVYEPDNQSMETQHRKAHEVNENGKVQARINELLESCDSKDITPELIEKGLLTEAQHATESGSRVNAWGKLAQVKSMLIQVNQNVERTMTDSDLIDQIADGDEDFAAKLREKLGAKP